MTIDVTQIVISILSLVFSIVTAWAGKVLIPRIKAWLDAKATAEQQQIGLILTRQLVEAAEQVIGAGLGSEKMKYVVTELRNRGIEVDVSAIEAAVHQMNTNMLAPARVELPNVIGCDVVPYANEKEAEE